MVRCRNLPRLVLILTDSVDTTATRVESALGSIGSQYRRIDLERFLSEMRMAAGYDEWREWINLLSNYEEIDFVDVDSIYYRRPPPIYNVYEA